jgi:hypothetical protein
MIATALTVQFRCNPDFKTIEFNCLRIHIW